MPTPPADPDRLAQARELRARGFTVRDIAARLGISVGSVSAATRNVRPTTKRKAEVMSAGGDDVGFPEPAREAVGPPMPDPTPQGYEPVKVDTPGWYLVMSDVHIPFHSPDAIKKAVAEAESKGAVGVILNGDILDCHSVSTHYREPDGPRMKEEIEKGRQFLAWLRSRFPMARIVYKAGNHDERLRRYIAGKAPDLFDIEDIRLENLLQCRQHGIDWVEDKRVIELGKLPVIHGHEYRGSGGVMPARWLFIRAWSSALCGHFHQPSHFTALTLDRREMGVWSTGCLCYLHPQYQPNNSWAHGYAMVEVLNGGGFHVENRRILQSGQIV